jgi:signal peptidase II
VGETHIIKDSFVMDSTRTNAECCYRWLFWTLALIGLAADQTSKYGIFAWLYADVPGPHIHPVTHKPICERPYVVVPEYFNLVARYSIDEWTGEGLLYRLRTISGPNMPMVNHGALFGIGNDTAFGNFLFTSISLVAAVGIILWTCRSSAARDRYLCFALGLILAGTLGNFYDRMVFGGVRDFFHCFNLPLPFGLDNFPVFNVADCCLVTGASLLVLEAFFRKPVPETPPQEQVAVEFSAAAQS